MEGLKFVLRLQRRPRAGGRGLPDGKVIPCVSLAVLACVAMAACSGASMPGTSQPSNPTALWSAGMETGDLSEWYAPKTNPGGDVENIGNASAAASNDFAHTGKSSAKLTITTLGAQESGAQLFRWDEPDRNPQLYYRAWYYFPQSFSPTLFWNLMEWKSKHLVSGVKTNDPFFSLEVGALTSGEMYFYLSDSHTKTTYAQSSQAPVPIPVGQWVHVEAFYKSDGNGSGEIRIWQDGTQLWDIANVDTRYADGDTEWSVNSYSSGLTPATATIYVDDAAISTSQLTAQ